MEKTRALLINCFHIVCLSASTYKATFIGEDVSYVNYTIVFVLLCLEMLIMSSLFLSSVQY